MVDINEKLLDFLHKSPTCFHAIDEIKKVLVKQGYRELSEADSWNLEIDGRYFTVRNQSSIIAFRIPTTISGFSFTLKVGESLCAAPIIYPL